MEEEEWDGDAHSEVGLLPKRTFLADEREGKRIRNDLHLLTRNIGQWEEKRRSGRRIWLCDTFWLTLWE